MAFISIYLWGGVAIGGMIVALWLLSLMLRNSAIIDIFWSIGFLLAGGVYLVLNPSAGLANWLLYGMMLVWGLRLALHILFRAIGKPEDARYAAWRREAGKSWWWRSFFKVFLMQGVIAWLLSLPFAYALAKGGEAGLAWHDYAGAALFLFGFLFEAVGDAQLAAFKRNPENKGKVLDSGLWSLTRHPNYFGESVLWWGFFVVALPAAPLWTVFSPLVMTWLLIRVSGVKMLDELLARTKPGYAEYMQRTSGFIPLPKKRSGS